MCLLLVCFLLVCLLLMCLLVVYILLVQIVLVCLLHDMPSACLLLVNFLLVCVFYLCISSNCILLVSDSLTSKQQMEIYVLSLQLSSSMALKGCMLTIPLSYLTETLQGWLTMGCVRTD